MLLNYVIKVKFPVVPTCLFHTKEYITLEFIIAALQAGVEELTTENPETSTFEVLHSIYKASWK